MAHSIPRPALALRAIALAALPLLAVGAAACGGGGGGGGGGGTADAHDLASVTPSAQVAATNSGAGDFAADYLRSTHFTSLLVEIDYPAGKAPSADAVQLLHDRLVERCDKPDGISVLVDEAIPRTEFPGTLSVADLQDIENSHRGHFSDLATKTAVMYVLYVTGHSDLDGASTQVLGLSYAGSSIAFFIDNAGGGAPFVTDIDVEATGLVHESGHMMGLVDGGVPMVVPHVDPTSAFHDKDPACVMYWIIHVGGVSGVLGDPTFAQFDVHCMEDTTAFGGKAAGTPLFVGSSARAAQGAAAVRYAAGTCGNAAAALGNPAPNP